MSPVLFLLHPFSLQRCQFRTTAAAQSSADIVVRWSLPPELLQPPPLPKKDAKGGKVEAPPPPPTPGVHEGMVVLTLVGGDHPRRIALQVGSAWDSAFVHVRCSCFAWAESCVNRN